MNSTYVASRQRPNPTLLMPVRWRGRTRVLAACAAAVATAAVATHAPNVALLIGGSVGILAGSLIEHGGDPSQDAPTDEGGDGTGDGEGDSGGDGD